MAATVDGAKNDPYRSLSVTTTATPSPFNTTTKKVNEFSIAAMPTSDPHQGHKRTRSITNAPAAAKLHSLETIPE